MKYEEENICKELINKYTFLKEYQIKGKDRLKTQKSSIESILQIITDEEDKLKFYEYMNIYNLRKGKKPFKVISPPEKTNNGEKEEAEEKEEEDKAEEEKEEEVEKEAEEEDKAEDDKVEEEEEEEVLVKKVVVKKESKSEPVNNDFEKMKKQRDNVLKKLNKLQEKHDNLSQIHEDFRIDYKEVCNERNKLQLTMEKKGWNKELRKEFDKYKSFYQKYSGIVDELDKHKK